MVIDSLLVRLHIYLGVPLLVVSVVAVWHLRVHHVDDIVDAEESLRALRLAGLHPLQVELLRGDALTLQLELLFVVAVAVRRSATRLAFNRGNMPVADFDEGAFGQVRSVIDDDCGRVPEVSCLAEGASGSVLGLATGDDKERLIIRGHHSRPHHRQLHLLPVRPYRRKSALLASRRLRQIQKLSRPAYTGRHSQNTAELLSVIQLAHGSACICLAR